MDTAGPSIRILCDALCLINYEGESYHGMIENVSLTGALIKMDDAIPIAIRPGVTCNLMLYSDMPSCRTEYKCLVIRLDSTRVGLQFLEMNAAGQVV